MAKLHRTDGWINVKTGYGTLEDATEYAQFYAPNRLSERELEDLYVAESLAYRIVSLIVDEATRQGWTLSSEDAPEVAEEIHRLAEEKFRYTSMIAQFCKESRLYGGIAVLIRADDGTDWESGTPLRPEAIRKVAGFDIIRPCDLNDREADKNPLSVNFGNPLTYDVRFTTRAAGMYIGTNHHASRLMMIDQGIRVTQRKRDEKNYGFSDSVLVPVLDAIKRYRTAFATVNTLISNASQGIYKIKGLNEILNSENQDEILRTRFNQIDSLRSALHSVILDSDGEDFARVATPLSELANLIDRFMMDVAQAANTPIC